MFYDAIVDAREATVGAGLLYQWRDKVSMLQDILEGDCKVEMGVSMVGEGTRVQQPCFVACGAEGRIACGLRGQPRRREAGRTRRRVTASKLALIASACACWPGWLRSLMVANAVDGWSFSRFGLVERKKPGRAVCEHLSTPRSNEQQATPTVLYTRANRRTPLLLQPLQGVPTLVGRLSSFDC
jgi:hypothetical protein